MGSTEHVLHNCVTSELICEHCGQRQYVPLPMRVELVCALSNAFLKIHRRCKKPEEPHG